MPSILVHSGTLVDASSERQGWIVVDDGRIVSLGTPGEPAPPADRSIDASGRYVTPGFVDIHGHGAGGSHYQDGVDQALAALRAMEKKTGKRFGDPSNPLLVSCRSGAKFSMPGMMDTVLDIGLNDEVTEGMIKLTGNERFAYDSYRRLIQMYGTVVLGVRDEPFEDVLAHQRERRGVSNDAELTGEDFKTLDTEFKENVRRHEIGRAHV